MSTVQKVNFEPVSDIFMWQTRDFPLQDPSLADPLNAVALCDGEWMTVNGTSLKMQRASAIGTPTDPATAISYPYWAERGRTDVQASSGKKGPLVYLNQWEADLRLFLVSSMTHGGRVAVQTITIGSRNYSGLVANGTFASPGAGISVGVITRLPAVNNGKLRIRGGAFY